MNTITRESRETIPPASLDSSLNCGPGENSPGENSPRRTVLYLDHTARLGGGEIALLNLVCALDPERYRPIVVLAADGPLAERLRAAGIDTRVVPLDAAILNTRKDSLGGGSLLKLRAAWVCLLYALTLARLARSLKADLIHTNSLKSDLYGGLAGRLAGIPVLWHVRDRIDENYLPPQAATLFRRLAHILPHAVVANSESTLRTLRLLRRQPSAAVYSGIVDAPAGASVLPLTEDNDAEMPLEVVLDDFYSHQFALRAAPFPAHTSAHTVPVVSLVGRIAEWKGQHIFIQAAALTLAEFPLARFQIIGAPLFGEEAYEQTIHQMVADLGLSEQIVFLGFRDDVAVLLADTDIVAHASILGEPFGQVVVQGMAAGKPIVATNGGALPEIVLPGETGLLVPMGDAPAMARAFIDLLADPDRAKKMGQAGRRRVRERFTMTQTLHALEGLYTRLLGTAR